MSSSCTTSHPAMRRTTTRIFSGAIAVAIGLAVVPVTFLGSIAVLARLDLDLPPDWGSFGLVSLVVVSCFLGCETFRGVFNGLCERYSEEPTPPRIARFPWLGWLGIGRNTVRSS